MQLHHTLSFKRNSCYKFKRETEVCQDNSDRRGVRERSNSKLYTQSANPTIRTPTQYKYDSEWIKSKPSNK